MNDDRWLDKDQKFYNYRTSEVDGSNIFDVNKASNSWSQNFLDDPKYMLESENAEMSIIYMTPLEYWKICARDVFNKPVDQLMNQWRRLDGKTLDHLTQVILKYKKRFPITYINYASHNHPTQEGLHRMIVAGDLFGWDTKFPVMVIKWADEEKAAKEKENKRKNEVENNISKAVDKALRYKYYNMDELKDQLYSEIQYELKYDDEFEDREFKLDLITSDDNLGILAIVDNKYEVFISYDEIEFQEKSLDNDLDDDDISDWLRDILNEEYVIPEEFLRSKELQDELIAQFGENFSEKPICKEVCEYVKDRCLKCELLSFAISVWKDLGSEFECISNKGHCVIRLDNSLYDYTSNQYIDYGIDYSDGVRILPYNEKLSKALNAKIYSNKNYMIVV